MSVKVFFGAETSGYELEAVRELKDLLKPLESDYIILANVEPIPRKNTRPHKQIDLLIFGPDRVFLIELKRITDAFGKPIEAWEREDGKWETKKSFLFDEIKPKDQLRDQYQNLKNWLAQDHIKKNVFERADRAEQLSSSSFNDIKKFIAIYPKKHPKSRFDAYLNTPDQAYQLTGNRGGVICYRDIVDLLQHEHYSSGFDFGRFTYAEQLNVKDTLGCLTEDELSTKAENDRPRIAEHRENTDIPDEKRKRKIPFPLKAIIGVMALIGILSGAYFFLFLSVNQSLCDLALSPDDLESQGLQLDGTEAIVRFLVSNNIFPGPLRNNFLYIDSASSSFSLYVSGNMSELDSVRSKYLELKGKVIAVKGIVYQTNNSSSNGNWQLKVTPPDAMKFEICN